ncbi:hypothetical protein OUZ56_022820 [Daphnia magna]|uniref:PH domain-containing protein n=1 Tax=Daphnia magna TaxID=35525 RepID=A0ABR0AXK0_9CRUS|nr:hypothetical protein OUZ56_022820 [Daphnia magna]
MLYIAQRELKKSWRAGEEVGGLNRVYPMAFYGISSSFPHLSRTKFRLDNGRLYFGIVSSSEECAMKRKRHTTQPVEREAIDHRLMGAIRLQISVFSKRQQQQVDLWLSALNVQHLSVALYRHAHRNTPPSFVSLVRFVLLRTKTNAKRLFSTRPTQQQQQNN